MILILQNKKVHLRERKRHTTRRIASARFADQYPDREGVPHPVLDEGVPLPVLHRGVPHPVMDRGYPLF